MPGKNKLFKKEIILMTPSGYILINLVYESDYQKGTFDEKQNSKIASAS